MKTQQVTRAACCDINSKTTAGEQMAVCACGLFFMEKTTWDPTTKKKSLVKPNNRKQQVIY